MRFIPLVPKNKKHSTPRWGSSGLPIWSWRKARFERALVLVLVLVLGSSGVPRVSGTLLQPNSEPPQPLPRTPGCRSRRASGGSRFPLAGGEQHQPGGAQAVQVQPHQLRQRLRQQLPQHLDARGPSSRKRGGRLGRRGLPNFRGNKTGRIMKYIRFHHVQACQTYLASRMPVSTVRFGGMNGSSSPGHKNHIQVHRCIATHAGMGVY